MGQQQFSVGAVEKLAAAIVAGMIMEARYRGVDTDASEIARVIESDPNGATADYFRHNAAGALDLYAAFRADPELLALFSGESAALSTNEGGR